MKEDLHLICGITSRWRKKKKNVIFCANCRGHEFATTKNKGNFVQLLETFSEFDPALAEHLRTFTIFEGTSKSIQNNKSKFSLKDALVFCWITRQHIWTFRLYSFPWNTVMMHVNIPFLWTDSAQRLLVNF